MTPEPEARAKQLFFDYDGSTFFMSRDGVDEEFEAIASSTSIRLATGV